MAKSVRDLGVYRKSIYAMHSTSLLQHKPYAKQDCTLSGFSPIDITFDFGHVRTNQIDPYKSPLLVRRCRRNFSP